MVKSIKLYTTQPFFILLSDNITLLCTRHHARNWEYSSKRNTQGLHPQGTHILIISIPSSVMDSPHLQISDTILPTYPQVECIRVYVPTFGFWNQGLVIDRKWHFHWRSENILLPSGYFLQINSQECYHCTKECEPFNDSWYLLSNCFPKGLHPIYTLPPAIMCRCHGYTKTMSVLGAIIIFLNLC